MKAPSIAYKLIVSGGECCDMSWIQIAILSIPFVAFVRIRLYQSCVCALRALWLAVVGAVCNWNKFVTTKSSSIWSAFDTCATLKACAIDNCVDSALIILEYKVCDSGLKWKCIKNTNWPNEMTNGIRTKGRPTIELSTRHRTLYVGSYIVHSNYICVATC